MPRRTGQPGPAVLVIVALHLRHSLVEWSDFFDNAPPKKKLMTTELQLENLILRPLTFVRDDI
jgi:hypothetical protein